jgi:TolB-like protein/Tfp pilus assembly protein PilF
MPQVFLSYKRQDLKVVTPLVKALRAAGLDVWWDRDIPAAAPWEDTIEKVLADASVVLVCWSKAAVASDNVRSEARRGREQGRLIQLFVEPCDPPLFFGEQQGIDLSGWSGDPSDPDFRQLVDAIGARTGSSTVAAPPRSFPFRRRMRKMRRFWLPAVAAMLALGAGGVFLFERAMQPSRNAVMLKPFEVVGNDPVTRSFAAGVSDDIGSALSAASVDVVGPTASGASAKAAFVLSGHAEHPGDDLHLTANLEDASDQTILWSTSFTRPSSQVQAMQEQVADNLAAVLHCALDTVHQRGGVQLDQDTIKPYLKACGLQQSSDPPYDQIRDLLKQVTAREPRFASGWARLAFISAGISLGGGPQQQAMRREAQEAAQTALRLDPKSGLAYEALTDLELGRVPFAVLHRQFQKALSFDPNNADVLNDDGELLLRMGSIERAVQMFRRAVELDPLSPHQVSDLVIGLIDDTRDSEAQAKLQQARRIWPDDNTLKYIHLDYQARLGDPGKALAILNDPRARPNLRDITLDAYRRLIEARKSRQPEQTRAFATWLSGQVAAGEFDAGFAAPVLAALGDREVAFKLAFAAPSEPLDNNAPDIHFLWQPDSIALRRDPRFIDLNRRFHIADFWHSTGLWPDFCGAPNWPYKCKEEDARLMAKARGKA